MYNKEVTYLNECTGYLKNVAHLISILLVSAIVCCALGLRFFCICSCVCGPIAIFFFNRAGRLGMICYEKLADELEWGKNRMANQISPNQECRIAIRDFLRAKDLPLTNSNGTFYYFGLYVIILLINGTKF
jgi:hypothetical protein